MRLSGWGKELCLESSQKVRITYYTTGVLVGWPANRSTDTTCCVFLLLRSQQKVRKGPAPEALSDCRQLMSTGKLIFAELEILLAVQQTYALKYALSAIPKYGLLLTDHKFAISFRYCISSETRQP